MLDVSELDGCKHIEFKGKYKKLLTSGKKRSTIRKRCYVREGEDVFVHCGGKIIGKAKILKIEEKKLEELDNSIAMVEGFKNRDELINEIKRIYDTDRVYVINFEFYPFKKPLTPEEVYYGSLSLRKIAERALKELELSEEEKRILETFLETGSVKKAAIKLGGIWERRKVRDVLRKCYQKLSEKADKT